MKPSRVKLLVIGVLGALVIAFGIFITVKKFGGFFDDKVEMVDFSDVINDDIDSDEDGLLDKEEKDIGTNIYDPDTDKDGFDDGEEVKLGYNPLKAETDVNMDVDGDGLTGEDEKKFGTDPKLADTDFDGYSDGEEVASGNNPLESNLSSYTALNSIVNNNNDSENNNSEENVVEISDKDNEQIDYLERAFSAKDIQSFQDNMTKYINSQSETEKITGEFELPEISDDMIKINSDANNDIIQGYINALGDIFYNNLNFQDSYSSYDMLSSLNGGSTDLVTQFSLAISEIHKQTKELEVPQDERLVKVHKDIVASFMLSEALINNVSKDMLIDNKDSTVDTMNNFSKLSYILQVKVVNESLGELNNIAHERHLQLPEFYF